jgi:hypothetical protein
VGGRPPLLPPLRPRRHQGAPRRRYAPPRYPALLFSPLLRSAGIFI